MGMEFTNLTEEELCDLICGKSEEEEEEEDGQYRQYSFNSSKTNNQK